MITTVWATLSCIDSSTNKHIFKLACWIRNKEHWLIWTSRHALIHLRSPLGLVPFSLLQAAPGRNQLSGFPPLLIGGSSSYKKGDGKWEGHLLEFGGKGGRRGWILGCLFRNIQSIYSAFIHTFQGSLDTWLMQDLQNAKTKAAESNAIKME